MREIARLTGTVAGTLHKELARLAEAGILIKSVSGNQVRYGANREGLIFEELAAILRKTSGVVDVLGLVFGPPASRAYPGTGVNSTHVLRRRNLFLAL